MGTRESEKAWFRMDAGQLREALAHELAAWLLQGYFSRYRANRFDGYARRLAKMAGLPIDEVYRTLRADALSILEDCGQQPHHIFRQ